MVDVYFVVKTQNAKGKEVFVELSEEVISNNTYLKKGDQINLIVTKDEERVKLFLYDKTNNEHVKIKQKYKAL